VTCRELIEQFAAVDRTCRVLAVGAGDRPDDDLQVIMDGAAGVVAKTATAPELIAAVQVVAAGGLAVTPQLARQLADELGAMRDAAKAPLPSGLDALRLPRLGSGVLTTMEAAVVLLVADGHTDQAIAQRVFMSRRSVQNYLASAREKLGLRGRAQLARWVSEQSEG
jgi:DNA-binding NarL/FixJ family response regulator